MMDPYERPNRATLRGLRLVTLAAAAMTALLIHAAVTAPGTRSDSPEAAARSEGKRP